MSTSDSVDRVFVHALSTVRRLPRTGSSRPPPSARLRLYGLYKQSMEGDVAAILPRPTLPPPSPSEPSHQQDNSNNNNNNGTNQDSRTNAVHRYASRDLRTREAQAEIEKWDAWHACSGLSRTEAKRRYISTLIETMKEYASGTQESRELVSELEFVWSQISSQSGGSGSGSRHGSNEEDSPRRTGLKPTESYASIPPGRGSRSASNNGNGRSPGPNRLRVLSPVSQRDSDAIIEAEENPDQEGEEQHSPSPLPAQQQQQSDPAAQPNWRQTIQTQISHLTLEITALREQLSQSHLLSSSSSYSPYTYAQLSLKWKTLYRLWHGIKYLLWASVRQVAINFILLAGVIVWGRIRGDRRVESWARERWKEVRRVLFGWLETVKDEVGWAFRGLRMRIGY